MKLRIKKNPLARVAFRIFVLCLCLLASTAHATAQEVVYELVTSKNQLVAGEKYIIVDVNNKIAMSWYYYNKNGYYGNRKAAKLNDSNFDGNSIKNISIAKASSDSTVYEIVLYQNKGETTWGIFDSVNKKFLCAHDKTKPNGMNLTPMRSSTVSPVPTIAKAKISFDKTENGNVNTKIEFHKNDRNESNRVLDTYDGRIFACYNHSSPTVALFRKRTGKLSVSQYGYTTYTSQEYNYIMPEGCQGFVVTKENDGIKLTEKYKSGDAVPAKTPLLIKAAPGTYPIYQTVRKAVAPAEGENLLRGEFDAEGNITYGKNKDNYYYYYKLTTNKDKANFGFYFGAEYGGPFKMSNTSRAYLVLPREQSSSVKSLVLDDVILETAVSLPTESKPTDGHTYDLSGRLCQGKLVPGIYIQNGRKIVVR
ncbi:MAG: hypothetical protein SPF66_08055 [Bacteroidaceae bacterium]|nr:hypothetical protein [Bacteroidaceae bacterium]